MTSDELMNLIGHVCEAYQNSAAHRVAASFESDYGEQEVQQAEHLQWEQIAEYRLREVERAVRAAFPAQATVEGFMPVRALPGGKVELRAIDAAARPVAVVFTGTEALNLGGRLTACGAVSLDRIGLKTDAELHPVPEGPAIGTAAVPPPVVPGPPAPAHRR
ncbi:hypothetical protein [Actinoplanes sp. NBRC 103695]|uniref:hypothetical protein n=1 Tax=Actinoplanes sp. NBRC 103695 TaxID=3032202 RepID=UPI0024A063C7|nr:hypothetical protein [Actinoplanes sp. NBRC 103695]GLZ01902.1 hypothetical protein Acsp02_91530 [Actinoplanes sp. NBRC 103695]